MPPVMRHRAHFHAYRSFQPFCHLKNETGAIVPEILFASKDIASVDSIKINTVKTAPDLQFLPCVQLSP
jgi:hypothetical protein